MGIYDWMQQNKINISDQQYNQMSSQFKQHVQATRHLRDSDYLQLAFKEAMADKSNHPKMQEIKRVLGGANNQEIQQLANDILTLRKQFME